MAPRFDSDRDSQLLHLQGQAAKYMPNACLHVLRALAQLFDQQVEMQDHAQSQKDTHLCFG